MTVSWSRAKVEVVQQARDVRVAQWLARRTCDSIPSRRAVVMFAYEGHGSPVVARMNAV